jgi:nitroimidazol reductase NimA-like FMN-containing flavoprotein (pyridoxamine 5'-phosphate oxidase superfamily)
MDHYTADGGRCPDIGGNGIMRKANKEIRDREVMAEVLDACVVGRLGTVGADGYPMIKPLNYVYLNGSIYFHSAPEGEKIENIRTDGRVCFEVDQPIAFVRGSKDEPCRAEYLYRSVIIRGRARLIEDPDERLRALAALMQKYQPAGGYGAFPPEKLAITCVVRIDIEQLTGKQDLGKEQHREAVQQVLMRGIDRPVALDP